MLLIRSPVVTRSLMLVQATVAATETSFGGPSGAVRSIPGDVPPSPGTGVPAGPSTPGGQGRLDESPGGRGDVTAGRDEPRATRSAGGRPDGVLPRRHGPRERNAEGDLRIRPAP